MASLIDDLKGQTFGFQDLKNRLGLENSKHCRFLLYDDLQKFKTIENLMELGAVIILLQIETKDAPKVGHFVILLDHGNHYEHFDSYGLNMDEELSFTKERHLTQIFKNSNKKILDNNRRLQMFREDINTCGRWCIARFLLKHLELDDFIAIFDHLKPQTPDEMVTVMTMLLKYKH